MNLLGKTNKKRLKETNEKLEEEDIESPINQHDKLKNHLVNLLDFSLIKVGLHYLLRKLEKIYLKNKATL
jgi:hypothetical protein